MVLLWHVVIPCKLFYEMCPIIFFSFFKKFISFCWRLETHCQERNLRHLVPWSFWFTFLLPFLYFQIENHYLFHILFRGVFLSFFNLYTSNLHTRKAFFPFASHLSKFFQQSLTKNNRKPFFLSFFLFRNRICQGFQTNANNWRNINPS